MAAKAACPIAFSLDRHAVSIVKRRFRSKQDAWLKERECFPVIR